MHANYFSKSLSMYCIEYMCVPCSYDPEYVLDLLLF